LVDKSCLYDGSVSVKLQERQVQNKAPGRDKWWRRVAKVHCAALRVEQSEARAERQI